MKERNQPARVTVTISMPEHMRVWEVCSSITWAEAFSAKTERMNLPDVYREKSYIQCDDCDPLALKAEFMEAVSNQFRQFAEYAIAELAARSAKRMKDANGQQDSNKK